MSDSTDVVVIGGGSAGICAALSASRDGSDVLLVESSRSLGGMGFQALVHTFCGLYMPDVSQPPKPANPGLPEEIEAEMRSLTNQHAPEKMGKVYVLPQHPATFDKIAKKLISSETIQSHFETLCTGVSRLESGKFKVLLKSSEKEWSIESSTVVDCSANAIVADFLNANRSRAELETLQRPAFIFLLKGVVNEPLSETFRMRLALDLVHAVKDGLLPPSAMGVSIRKSPEDGECFVSIDLDLPDRKWDPSSCADNQEIEKIGQHLALEITPFLIKNYPQFRAASSPIFPQSIGIRESHHWLGQYCLTEEDLINGQTFKDAVANASWPIELRETVKGPKFTFFKQPLPSQIPLRSLTSSEHPGIFFAGRCISATHTALASVRVMGTCFATGQAAGMAASIHSKGEHNVYNQARQIQKKLGLKKFLHPSPE